MRAAKDKARKTLSKIRREYNKVFHGSCLVLLYHRVEDLETDPQLLSVSPENFDSHLKHLREHYKLLTVEEFTHHLTNEIRFPENSVLITFDDGYADNLLKAIPILEKHESQALFYIATGTLGTSKEFWWDAIERIILLSQTQPAQKEFVLGNAHFDLQNLTTEKRLALYNDLLPALRKTPSAQREAKIDELAALFASESGRESHRAMTFGELKQMAASGAAVIGAHTHLHPSLAALSYEQQLDEISTSKRLLEEQLGTTIKHFSYPFGTILDYNEHTFRIVRELNFDLVAANYPEPVHRKSERFAFPRFLVRNWDLQEFTKQMKSFPK